MSWTISIIIAIKTTKTGHWSTTLIDITSINKFMAILYFNSLDTYLDVKSVIFFAYSSRSQLYQGIGWKMLNTYGLLFSIFFNQLSNLIKDSEWSMPFVILMIFIGFQVNFFSFFLFVSPFIHSYYLLQISFGRKKKRKQFQLYTNNELVVIIIIVVQIDCWTFWLLAPDVLLSFFFALSAWPHTHLLSSFSLLWLVLVYSKKMLIMNMNKRNGGKNHDYFGGPLLYFKYKPVFCFFSYLFF